jgi:hypothetical protein
MSSYVKAGTVTAASFAWPVNITLEPELFVQVPELVIPVPEIDSVPAFEMTQFALLVTVVPVPEVVRVVLELRASCPRFSIVMKPTEASVTELDIVVSTPEDVVVLLLSSMSSPYPTPFEAVSL